MLSGEKIPRVIISLINGYATHRSMLRGILDYERSHAKWAIDLRTGRRDETSFSAADWKSCDAIIVNRTTPALLKNIRSRRLPAVLVSAGPHPGFPGSVLRCDNTPIAVAAAQHLLRAGCISFVFVGVPGLPWSNLRECGFAASVKECGGQCLRWPTGDRQKILQLLERAPKPLGVFSADDIRAREVLDYCRSAHCSVPDEIAIVGVDNDEMLCEMSVPSLSSIPLATGNAGYRAAEILDKAMRGELKFGELPEIVYSGDTVVMRQSSSRALGKDALVRRCHNLIVARYGQQLRVPDIARELGVSRRTIETHFRSLTGKSIAEDILEVRLERAKDLLSETNHSQADIAISCGFCDASHLCATFRKKFRCSPSAFRRTSSPSHSAS